MQLSVSLAAVSSPERVQWNGYDLHLGELIGAGAFSSVHAVENSPRELGALAAKVITLEKTSGVSEEAALLESICHPHILRCYGSVLLDHRWHVLLLERAHGGELFERVQHLEQLEQQLCARWVGQLLDAVEHLHSVGVIHRDLKPENLLLSSSGPDSSLKVADLGTAKRSNDMTGLHTPCGSRGYAAPEQVLPLYGQHAAFYGRAADLWSCGVVAYVLLTGTMPFDPASVDPSTPASAELRVPAELVGEIDPNALALVRALLQLEPALRPTAADARSHAWLSASSAKTESELLTSKRLLLTPRRLRVLRAQGEQFQKGWARAERMSSVLLRTPPVEPLKLPSPHAASEQRPRQSLFTARSSGDDKGSMFCSRASPCSSDSSPSSSSAGGADEVAGRTGGGADGEAGRATLPMCLPRRQPSGPLLPRVEERSPQESRKRSLSANMRRPGRVGGDSSDGDSDSDSEHGHSLSVSISRMASKNSGGSSDVSPVADEMSVGSTPATLSICTPERMPRALDAQMKRPRSIASNLADLLTLGPGT